jgi:hypothetical protein
MGALGVKPSKGRKDSPQKEEKKKAAEDLKNTPVKSMTAAELFKPSAQSKLQQSPPGARSLAPVASPPVSTVPSVNKVIDLTTSVNLSPWKIPRMAELEEELNSACDAVDEQTLALQRVVPRADVGQPNRLGNDLRQTESRQYKLMVHNAPNLRPTAAQIHAVWATLLTPEERASEVFMKAHISTMLGIFRRARNNFRDGVVKRCEFARARGIALFQNDCLVKLVKHLVKMEPTVHGMAQAQSIVLEHYGENVE